MFKKFFKKHFLNKYFFTAVFPILFVFVAVLFNSHFQEITQRSTKEVVKFGCLIMLYYNFVKTMESKDIREVRFIVISFFGLIGLLVLI